MKIKTLTFPDHTGLPWYLFSLLLSIGYLLLVFADIGDTAFSGIYFNSDMLYDPVIFRDLFVDGTGLRGWHLNAAPNFFPDMFFYFIINAVTGNFIAANFFFSILQYLTMIFLVLWLFRQVMGKDRAFTYATAVNFLFFLFILIPVYTERFRLMFQLISVSYHMGSFLMFLLSMNLLIDYFRRKRPGSLILLFVAVLLGTFNDRLFISQFVFPVMATAVLLYNKVHRKQLLKPILLIVGATVTGLLCFKLLRLYQPIHIIGTGFKMFNFDNMAESWHTFTSYMVTLFTDGWGERLVQIVFLCSFILGLIYTWKQRKEIFMPGAGESDRYVQDHYKRYLVVISTIYLPVTLLVPVINGGFVAASLIRFNIMAFYFGLILLPMFIGTWPDKPFIKKVESGLKYLLPGVATLFTVLFVLESSRSEMDQGLQSYFNFYPENVGILDSLQQEHDLTYGIGNYWNAKYITMLSHEGVRLYTVYDGSLRPFYHSTNENWYHSGGKGKHKDPVFNYVVRRKNPDNSKLLEIFDNKIDTIYNHPDEDFMVFKVPEFMIDRETKEVVVSLQSAVGSGQSAVGSRQ